MCCVEHVRISVSKKADEAVKQGRRFCLFGSGVWARTYICDRLVPGASCLTMEAIRSAAIFSDLLQQDKDENQRVEGMNGRSRTPHGEELQNG